jgi:hypothetical protein
MGRFDESIEAFRPIARRTLHLKHPETLLWLDKLLEAHPELVHLDDFSAYTELHVSRFDNPNQRPLFQSLSYILGRERIAEGDMVEARKLLSQVPADHPYGAAAKKCLALAR